MASCLSNCKPRKRKKCTQMSSKQCFQFVAKARNKRLPSGANTPSTVRY